MNEHKKDKPLFFLIKYVFHHVDVKVHKIKATCFTQTRKRMQNCWKESISEKTGDTRKTLKRVKGCAHATFNYKHVSSLIYTANNESAQHHSPQAIEKAE